MAHKAGCAIHYDWPCNCGADDLATENANLRARIAELEREVRELRMSRKLRDDQYQGEKRRLIGENEALKADAERYRLALAKIEYSMSQALIPGNDKWREILLSKEIAEVALEDDAALNAGQEGEAK